MTEPLSREALYRLKSGAEIFVLWQGGSTPIRYALQWIGGAPWVTVATPGQPSLIRSINEGDCVWLHDPR